MKNFKRGFELRILMILGNAVKKGATEEELDILHKAIPLMNKYFPTKEDIMNKKES